MKVGALQEPLSKIILASLLRVDTKSNRARMQIFPPYLSRFLLVTILLMITSGMSSSLAVLHLRGLDARWVMDASSLSILIFVFFNILVTRGLTLGLKALEAQAVVCVALSLVSLLSTGSVVLCGGALCAGTCIVIIRGEKYRQMFSYMKVCANLDRPNARRVVSGKWSVLADSQPKVIESRCADAYL